MDAAATVLENHEQDITDLEAAHLHLEDFENRAHRDNLCLRGVSETVTGLTSTATALFQELVPGIPIERLEFDRIHRMLGPKKHEGPPRDIVIKLTYYLTKETLLQAARDKPDLVFQGNRYQVFADLSQSTIVKRKQMKPYTSALLAHHIRYRWGFPVKLSFS